MTQASTMTLHHVSELRDIAVFEPRRIGDGEAVVWAIEERLLQNYLLPRDCPRVTFHAAPSTSLTDKRRFLQGDATHVVAIESAWLKRVEDATIYVYEVPRATFRCGDELAAYYVSFESVVPTECIEVMDLPNAIAERGVELRVLDSLWELHDEVAASTLAFSMIRMRNACCRQ